MLRGGSDLQTARERRPSRNEWRSLGRAKWSKPPPVVDFAVQSDRLGMGSMATTANFQVLRGEVIAKSDAGTWKKALLEWDVTSLEEHPSNDGVCVCGQTGLLWMYTIANELNGAELFPIGSSCVNHFGRTDLNRRVDVLHKLALVQSTVNAGKRVEMTTEFFSRAALKFLFEEGAFTPDSYNHGDGANDYEFLLKMFGKRDKSTINPKQQYKLRKLVEDKIVPFVLADPRVI